MDLNEEPSQLQLRQITQFFPELFMYIRFRGRQIRIWFILIFEFLIIISTNIKKEIVKRMFWGRNSFYRQAFHFIILTMTVLTFFNGVAGRIAGETTNSGLNIAQGQVGSLDMIQQYANAKSFTVRTGDELPFELHTHVVAEGETLEDIAALYNLNDASPIQWANGLDPFRPKISAGQELLIPPMQGVLKEAKSGDTPQKIIKGVKNADLITVLELNDLASEDEIIDEGRIIFIPNGDIPKPAPVVAAAGGGAPVVLSFPNSGIDVPPGTFINPLGDSSCSGYSYSRGWSTYHTGVDLARSGGCWIRAAGPGTVSTARWCGSLGFCTVIEHADGLITLYGHGNGTFAVSEGQVVQAGQKIMYMGNTGRSFGTHLHLSLTANNNNIINCYSCRINPSGIIPF